MEEPSLQEVMTNIHNLYNNPDTTAKDKASKWLAEFQKSLFSWKIADQLLQQKADLHSCYFAAQTMRNKIQMSFHELPQTAHQSLRDSLIQHINHITPDTNPIIVTQLCLALTNLTLLMSSWQQPIQHLVEQFSANANTVQPLIVILTFIPEEIHSRYLRLGENRRTQIQEDLKSNSTPVLNFLQQQLMVASENGLQVGRFQTDIIKCFTSWVQMNSFKVNDLATSLVFQYAFMLMGNSQASVTQIDVASDCLCAVLQGLAENPGCEELQQQVFIDIMSLEEAYKLSVTQEDSDKSMNLCRIFTVMAECFLTKMIKNSTLEEAHYSIRTLDLLLLCVGHYDFEVAQITFNVWFRLSEELYNKNDTQLSNYFKTYVERLIEALYKHCQMEPDHDGLLEEGESFQEFRYKASELIKDVIFIVGSSACFKHMFMVIQSPNVTWESTEAALYIMESVARNIMPEENEIVPLSVEAILNLPENCHIAIRYTSINILGELCEWIDSHPQYLEAILNFLLNALRQKTGLASAAANSLQLICSHCKRHMVNHINGLLDIARCLELFEVQPEASVGILKGISLIIAKLPNDQIPDVLRLLCGFQISNLIQLAEETNGKTERGKKNEPSYWLDRLASIYRHVNPEINNSEEINPCACVIVENWPIISQIMVKYQHDSKVMERVTRCVRYAIRCIMKQALPILESLVKQMVDIYAAHKHSCLLYLGSILVDEFGTDNTCISGLLSMLEAFIEPTFMILQIENGLKDHPDTVDDFFRLSARFIQRSPLHFLQSSVVSPIIQCAVLACTLDHRDANMSVMKFLCSLLNNGRPSVNGEIKGLVQQVLSMHGETLVVNLIYASVFYLHSYMMPDVADVFVEMKYIDNDKFNEGLQKALGALPCQNSGGSITATENQLKEFYEKITKAQSPRQVTHALQEFGRLFR